jgi:hypothetical protein
VAVLAPKRAVFLVAALLAAGLAGCEYADDGGAAPSGAGPTGNSTVMAPVPIATGDPELVAELDRNLAALEIRMTDVPVGAGGAAGDISSQGNGEGGLEFSTQLTDGGTYTEAAGCIGAAEAKLSISSAAGNTRMEFTASCAGVLRHNVELGPGPVSVRLVADGQGYQNAATGVVRIYEAAGPVPALP